jgi:polyisoprenoid-binding protein YceI
MAPNWALLAWSMPYGWYEPPPPPERGWLPPAGRYRVDPERSTVAARVRSGCRQLRGAAAGLTGALRFGHDAHATVDLAVETAGLHADDRARDGRLQGFLNAPSFPLLRFAATDVAAVHGAWVLPGRLSLRGAAVPLALWLDPVRRLPDGTAELRARGTLDRRSSGLGRQVRVDVALVAVPEPVSFAPPCVARAPGAGPERVL